MFFVHSTHNKQAKVFEISNIYISFYSIKGCSINIKVKFSDPKGRRQHRQEKVNIDGPSLEENPESALIEVRRKMKIEQDNIRKFKFKM